jgi:hypothetical protein
MSFLSRTVSCCALVFLTVAVGCGARTGLSVETKCLGQSLHLAPRVPNLYFVLDHSESMSAEDKWAHVQEAGADLIVSLGPKATFGAAAFPGMGADQCATGSQVMPLTLGDGLPATQTGSVAASFLAATNFTPAGGTPTAATFTALTPVLAGFEGHTFAILATDGGPDCDSAFKLTGCPVDQCTPNIQPDPPFAICTPTHNCCSVSGGNPDNCLDATRTIAAVAALKAAGVPTFVIGLPSSEGFATTLAGMAEAGGTRAYYPIGLLPSGEADLKGLEGALATIAQNIFESCELVIDDSFSPGLVNVQLEGDELVAQDGPNGWTLEGKTVTLKGSACENYRRQGITDAGATQYSVTNGCPTLKSVPAGGLAEAGLSETGPQR